MMLFRGEISKRISFAFAVTEDNVYLTLSEKAVRDQNGADYDNEMRSIFFVLILQFTECTRIRHNISDVGNARQIHDHTFETHTETTVRGAAVTT